MGWQRGGSVLPNKCVLASKKTMCFTENEVGDGGGKDDLFVTIFCPEEKPFALENSDKKRSQKVRHIGRVNFGNKTKTYYVKKSMRISRNWTYYIFVHP